MRPEGPETVRIIGAPIELLFGVDVVTAEGVPALADHLLYPEELACIERAAPVRRAEFTTARVCARRALRELGVADAPLVPNRDRSPRWPAGIIGSITHCRACCAVVVARASAARSIGIDIESRAPLDRELEPLVCTPSELKWLQLHPDDDRGILGKIIFSAKEALYKCQYPLTHTFLDFQDVEARIDVDGGTFSVRGGHDVVALARGRLLRTADFIVTAATIV